MSFYLIEFRFHGKAKHVLQDLARNVHSKFHIRTEQHPHITLAGPFSTNDELKLISDFNHLCMNSDLMTFIIENYGFFDDSKVVFVDIKPSDELKSFRYNLSKVLEPYCDLKHYDCKEDFMFHATIASHISYHKYETVKQYIRNQPKPYFKHVVVRATLLKGRFILREYDFFLRKPLIRNLAKNKEIYAKTMNLLRGYFENKINPEEFKGRSIKLEEKGFLAGIKNLFRKQKIFITSDLHLDHINIIKYCNRPFLNIEDMNKTLVKNWNNTIRKNDVVYYLGDLAFGTGSKSTDYWLKKLNGTIIFIKGNHDKSDKITLYETYTFEYGEYNFFLTHEPENVPKDWKGWAICGHHHNNKLDEYPFIDKKNKRINISIELTKYKPVDMNDLIKMIEE